MTKIKQFDKVNLKDVRNDIDAALKAVCDKHGISLGLGNISYSHNTFRTTLNATVNDTVTGAVLAPEEAALKRFSKTYLGDKWIEGQIYMHAGKRIKFVGLMTRSRKYPVIYQDLATGKKYKMDDEVAKKIVDPSYVSIFSDRSWQQQDRL